MRCRARRSLILVPMLLSCSVLGQTNVSSSAVLAVPVANMFSADNPDSDVVSQAIYGASVVVLQEDSGWTRVRTPDQYSGWLRNDEIRRPTAAEQLYATSGKTAQVSGLTANLYREPDVTSHQPLLMIP